MTVTLPRFMDNRSLIVPESLPRIGSESLTLTVPNAPPPVDPLAAVRSAAGVPLAVVLIAVQLVLDTEWEKEKKLWQQGEAIVKDSLFNTVQLPAKVESPLASFLHQMIPNKMLR